MTAAAGLACHEPLARGETMNVESRPVVSRGAREVVYTCLLAGFVVCLIWPASVPDPFRVGPDRSWSLLCLLTAAPILGMALLQQQPFRTCFDVFIGLYVVAILATWPTAFSHSRTLVALFALTANVAVFYAFVVGVRRSATSPHLILIILVAGIAVLETMAVDFHVEVGAFTRPTVYDRPEGWGGYPELGLLAAIAFAILLAASQVAQPWWSKCALLVFLIVTLLQLAFLYSRMAWISVVAVIVAAGIVSVRTRRFFDIAAAVLVILVLAGVLVATNGTVRRLAGDLVGIESSVPLPAGVQIATPSMRIAIWQRTLRMIRDHWVAGVGLGNFQSIYEPYYNPELNPDGRRGVHAHNLWLHQTAELGVPGGLIYLSFWVAVLIAAWRRSRFSLIDQAFFYIVVAVAFRSLGDNMFLTTGAAPARLYTLTWLSFGVIAARHGGTDARFNYNR